MTTATTPGTGDRPVTDATGALLQRLFRFTSANTAAHPSLTPVWAALDEALTAHLAGGPDAGRLAVAVYRLIDTVRQTDPAVPEP